MSHTTMGVYAIRNRSTGERYVGVSVNIPGRWLQHVASLNQGCHDNRKLQSSWSQHGADAFSFDIVELVDSPQALADAEIRWINNEANSAGHKLLNVARRRLPDFSVRRRTPEGYLNLTQAAGVLGVSMTRLYSLVRRMDIEVLQSPYYQWTRMVKESDVEKIRSALTELGFYS